MKKVILVAIVILGGLNWCQAQLSFGFKAGINSSVIRGDNEKSDDGQEVETTEFKTGFHVGALFLYKVTDLFGLQAEVLFSQKGSTNKYDGPAVQILRTSTGNTLLTTGNRKAEVNITNSYVDVPVLVYGRLGSRIKVAAGINVGFLVSSTATGELNYSGQTMNGSPVPPFTITLEYDYYRDDVGDIDLEDPIVLNVGNTTVQLPRTANAYFDYEVDNGNFFKVVDFGLNGELDFFINQGLFIGLRANYGLTDVTNDAYDISRTEFSGNSYAPRADNDTNLSLQASLGFSF